MSPCSVMALCLRLLGTQRNATLTYWAHTVSYSGLTPHPGGCGNTPGVGPTLSDAALVWWPNRSRLARRIYGDFNSAIPVSCGKPMSCMDPRFLMRRDGATKPICSSSLMMQPVSFRMPSFDLPKRPTTFCWCYAKPLTAAEFPNVSIPIMVRAFAPSI